MSYIADLNMFNYGDTTNKRSALNVYSVGWLDKPTEDIPIKTAHDMPPGFMDLVKEAPLLKKYRGSHLCQWCGNADGNGEKWMVGVSGRVYVMPALIVHYIEEHGYVPPETCMSDVSHYLVNDEQVEEYYVEEKGYTPAPSTVSCSEGTDSWYSDQAKKIASEIDSQILSEMEASFTFTPKKPMTHGIPEQATSDILKHLEAIEKQYDVKVIYAVESGSRAWGLASEASDMDVRFIYIQNPKEYINLSQSHKALETISWMSEDRVYDIHGWDISKAFQLTYQQNPCISEWLMSDVVYVEGVRDRQIKWLRDALHNNYNDRAALYHYIHMARGNYEKYLAGDEVSIKKYLYVLRPLMCCEYILKNKSAPPMVMVKMVDQIEDIDVRGRALELIKLKKESPEKLTVAPKDAVLDDYIHRSLEKYEHSADKLMARLSLEERASLYTAARLEMQEAVKSATKGYYNKEWKW